MPKYEFDVAWDCPVQEFFDHLEKYEGQVAQFEAHGPGGGNPCVLAEFPDRAKAEEFVREWNRPHGQVEVDYHLGLITD